FLPPRPSGDLAHGRWWPEARAVLEGASSLLDTPASVPGTPSPGCRTGSVSGGSGFGPTWPRCSGACDSKTSRWQVSCQPGNLFPPPRQAAVGPRAAGRGGGASGVDFGQLPTHLARL